MKNNKIDNTHKLLKYINRYTIGLLIIMCLSFFIEKKFFINEPTKKIRIIISTLLFFSSYVFILKNFKIEFNKKKKFNIRIFIRDNLTNIKYLFAILIPILNTIWYRNIYYLSDIKCDDCKVFWISSFDNEIGEYSTIMMAEDY